MLRLDGSAFDAETTGASVILEGMRVLQMIIHDISARKKADAEILKLGRELEIHAAQLEDTNKELEAFVYSVSHDLRAPLRTISGFAKILKEDYAEKFDTQGKDYVERVWNGSERMSLVIEGLLRLSTITRQEIDRMDFDLGKLAESVVENIRRTSPGQSVEVVLPRGLRAFVDPNLIRIAFENLFENAWKFSSKKENARIEFGTLEQDGKTVFFIRDNGAGFDKTYAHKLFKPFHRLHTDAEFPGTGIGLSIVKRIIRRHGGTIWAESESGEGAIFYFTLG
jgi:light-regulated signal transduction histidine kinase (bacteriophytochrome)